MSGDGKYGRPSGRDTVENLYARIERIELDFKRLKDTKRAAFDRGATALVPAPYEGQTIIQGTDIYYYAEGAWRTPGGGPISALAIAYNRSQAIGGKLEFQFDDIYYNDASFGYEVVASSRAKYVTVSSEGFYRIKYYVSWNTDFTAGDAPYIEPSLYVGGSNQTFAGYPAVYWDDTANIIYGEQLTAAEMDHHQLTAEMYFNFDATEMGEAAVGLGVNLRSTIDRTKNYGAGMVVTRLEDQLTNVAIV